MEIKNLEQILAKRAKIEQELFEISEEVNGDFSIDDIKKIIYNEENQDDLTKIIMMFDNGQNTDDMNVILGTINDAWNYFPHKFLGGISPAEKLLEYQLSRNKKSEKKALGIPKIPNIPKSICISVRYDKELQKITGKEEYSVTMSEGATFAYLLHNIFMEYPEIGKRYPPGTLKFSVYDIPPKLHTPLFDGSVVVFWV